MKTVRWLCVGFIALVLFVNIFSPSLTTARNSARLPETQFTSTSLTTYPPVTNISLSRSVYLGAESPPGDANDLGLTGNESPSGPLDDDCDVVCQPGDLIECPETPGPYHYLEDCDGGCHRSPPVFGMVLPGIPFCGLGFTYTCASGDNCRDTDWLEFNLPMESRVSVQITAAFPVLVAIVDHIPCDSADALAYAEIPTACTATEFWSNCLAPGMYALYVAPLNFTGVPVSAGYRVTIQFNSCTGCPCATMELEPNNAWPPTQMITVGEDFCGEISPPQDSDFVAFHLPYETAVRITIYGNNAVGTCPSGQGLNPWVELLTDLGDVLALGGDSLNNATTFTSTFKLGAMNYGLMVTGMNSFGPYILHIDPVASPTAPPPEPVVTIHHVSGNVQLQWYASYFPDELICIERSLTSEGPWEEIAILPGEQTEYSEPEVFPTAFYRVSAIGARSVDPNIGSILPLGEGPEGAEMMSVTVNRIEWAVNGNDEVVLAYLAGQLSPPYDGSYVVQDHRNQYGSGLTPIREFTGHKMTIEGETMVVDHLAFGRMRDSGEIGIIDGVGHREGEDSLRYFGSQIELLQPGDESGPYSSRCYFCWWFCRLVICCRVKVVAVCSGAIPPAAPPGVGGPIWPCGPGSPFPPPPGVICPPVPPPFNVCTACTLRQEAGRVWCICPWQPSPPNPMMCTFKVWLKCKKYDCPEEPLLCWCPAPPICPSGWIGPLQSTAGWKGFRNACRTYCLP